MKQTKAAFMRSWQLPEKFKWNHLRYKSPPIKGVYWYHFAKMIRDRDMAEWGSCISCGKPMSEGGNAGHFCPAGSCGPDLLFDEKNCNLECARCNAWDEGHLFGYEAGLDARYGKGTAQGLKARYMSYKKGGSQKDWSAAKFVEKLQELGVVCLSL